jgi:ubiquinone biosynthesis protein Coq4
MAKLIDGLRFLSAYISIVRDPNDLGRVFRLIDRTAEVDAHRLDALLGRPEVAAYTRSDIPALRFELSELRRLPAGSLGHSLAEFLDARRLEVGDLHHHDAASALPFDRARAHLDRTHDVWHVVTGFDTDVAGELGLQAFYFAQLELPPAVAIVSAGLLNGLIREPKDLPRRLEAIALGWQLGRRTRPLFGTDWAKLWSRPLAEVQAQLGVEPVTAAAPERAAA